MGAEEQEFWDTQKVHKDSFVFQKSALSKKTNIKVYKSQYNKANQILAQNHQSKFPLEASESKNSVQKQMHDEAIKLITEATNSQQFSEQNHRTNQKVGKP